MAEASNDHDLAHRIEQFLDANHVLSLATISTAGPDITPHAANLFYARDGLALIWVSDAQTRHSQDLEKNPAVAATIAPDVADYQAVRGLQIAGTARRVAETGERDRLLGLLIRRYPFLAAIASAPESMQGALVKAGVCRLTPSRIVLIDNARGFGHKECLLPGAAR
jgi:uncharacterized protein YhbP (UPF0306 family)